MEKFEFYLNPAHYLKSFWLLKWGLSEVNRKMKKKLLDQISLFFADLPHTRPFPGLWCKKKFHFDFSQKNEKKLKIGF